MVSCLLTSGLFTGHDVSHISNSFIEGITLLAVLHVTYSKQYELQLALLSQFAFV